MVSGRYRSRSFRRVYVKTPKHGTKLVYKKRKSNYQRCANCHAIIKGKSSRLYNNLCSKCSRRKVISSIR